MRVHFIAIGGSAMHNLAIALHLKGYEISGSDDEIFEPSYTRLKKHGLLPVEMGWSADNISTELDAVILGMHARIDNPELLEAQKLGLKIYSYPEYLYEQSKDKKRVVIGGSHGKTTITAMILHILKFAEVDTDYMVGAQLEGFDVMVRLSHEAEWMIMEGDEYLTSPIDRRPKFLHYKPNIALISGIGWDHINVFPTFDNYLQQFRDFIKAIEPGGCLIYNQEDEEVQKLVEGARCEIKPYQTHQFEMVNNRTVIPVGSGRTIELDIFGRHNLSNLSAAIAVCEQMGIAKEMAYDAIKTFQGASKRLECLGSNDHAALYRDFAHAPSKVKASTAALKLKYSDRQLIVCLELHTFSSLSASFIDQYANCLDEADSAVVFYDHHSVELKKLALMDAELIKTAFRKKDIVVVNDPEELLAFIDNVKTFPLAVACMSSGSFRGLDFNRLKRIISL
ncbi:MAG: UDP-N-acetylmuramate: L-alanyl-gamma-D-glutamyl-meso-diaminopimelate ligase [Bacteroidetes bacterium]|nr:MAG: UDP-N-acetylmuramate: L-alanyl-gamma-D-glutamyl-meso-diaminopimelate ligase [Bacteroidota bacterium]